MQPRRVNVLGWILWSLSALLLGLALWVVANVGVYPDTWAYQAAVLALASFLGLATAPLWSWPGAVRQARQHCVTRTNDPTAVRGLLEDAFRADLVTEDAFRSDDDRISRLATATSPAHVALAAGLYVWHAMRRCAVGLALGGGLMFASGLAWMEYWGYHVPTTEAVGATAIGLGPIIALAGGGIALTIALAGRVWLAAARQRVEEEEQWLAERRRDLLAALRTRSD